MEAEYGTIRFFFTNSYFRSVTQNRMELRMTVACHISPTWQIAPTFMQQLLGRGLGWDMHGKA
jgi:hypothetical protein